MRELAASLRYISAIFEKALKLPEEDRNRLALELLDSLKAPNAAQLTSAEIQRRAEEAEVKPGRTWKAVKKSALERLRD